MNAWETKRRLDQTAIYCLGRVEQFIEDYAKSSNLPQNELGARVAELLHTQMRREPPSGTDNLPDVRRKSVRSRNSVTIRALALARNSHRRPPSSLARYARSSLKGYKYPKGTHWTQKPENKQKLLRQVRYAQQRKRMKNAH
jgi:hypothetical protein